jgi:hypothetical protein
MLGSIEAIASVTLSIEGRHAQHAPTFKHDNRQEVTVHRQHITPPPALRSAL